MLVKLSSSLLGANSSLSEPVSFEQWLSLIAIWNKGHNGDLDWILGILTSLLIGISQNKYSFVLAK